MTEKIGIEFDQEIFPNKSDCTHWLRQRPEYESFLENKKFELKSCQRSDFMSTEPRKVWHWKKLAKFSHFATERPDNYVLVIKSMPGPYHYPSQMPPPTAKFQAAEQKKNFQLQEREFKQRKKYEANRNKRKLSKKPKTEEQKQREKIKRRERNQRQKKQKVEKVKEEEDLIPLGAIIDKDGPSLTETELAIAKNLMETSEVL